MLFHSALARGACAALFVALMNAPISAQPSGPTSPASAPTSASLEAREWFQNARFGMFIHWGLYSLLADGEWVLHNKKLRLGEYESLARTFHPQDFDAAEWVGLAKAAGMKYITFTSKHHDGFAMWDSQVSDWNIVDRTPYGKDIVRQLADECRKQGVKLFLYHSHLDWRHPDFFPWGGTGRHTGRAESGEWTRYLDFMDAQLTELLTGYGDIGGVWFDGFWDRPDADWRLEKTYKMIHDLQPAALIGNNHHRKPFPGEDFQMYERDLPGHNASGFNTGTEMGELPLETCDTMNGAWGYTITDRNWKSARDLIRYLVRSAGYGANFLLNVGPAPNGQIPPESVERLRAMGAWLEKYGESVYGTRGGPTPARPWGVTTRKPGRVYVHVLDWADPVLAVAGIDSPVKSASYLKDGSAVPFLQTSGSVVLTLPPATEDDWDRIVALDTE